jgi:hypothetical protein
MGKPMIDNENPRVRSRRTNSYRASVRKIRTLRRMPVEETAGWRMAAVDMGLLL